MLTCENEQIILVNGVMLTHGNEVILRQVKAIQPLDNGYSFTNLL